MSTVRHTFRARLAITKASRAQRDALAAGGEFILGASNATVPIEEGTLERSGAVTVVKADEAAVSYDTPYAARQHEELTWRHDAGRRAKFLELAVAESGDEALAIMAAKFRQELGG